MEKNAKKQFVVVHGACHGAWWWYKLVTLLKVAGHNVTALDLSSCGVDPQRLDGVETLNEQVQPLMEFMSSLPQNEKIVLVGHSYGGITMSQAVERFRAKILVAVYVIASAPSYKSAPANIIQEDLELAKLLVRPYSLFLEDLSNESLLTEDKFGSVDCAYVVCIEDQCLKEDFQRLQIEESSNMKDVKVIEGADHMAMLSKPRELCACLLEIADSFYQNKTS